MSKKFKFPVYLIISILLTLGMTVSLQSLLAAWTAPTAVPPGNNIDAPLNVGSTAQAKNGNLALGQTSTSTYTLYVNGNSFSLTGFDSSDVRLKKNIFTLENSLDKVLNLRGVSYEWDMDKYDNRGFEAGKQIGVIAQELEQVFPELVKTDGQGFKAVSYDKLTAVLIEAIKAQQKEIDELKATLHPAK